MSDNASENYQNDNGDMIEAAADAGENRGNYDNDSAKTNTAAYTEADDNETLALVETQTGGIADDVRVGSGSDLTLAEIHAGANITANGTLAVEAEETFEIITNLRWRSCRCGGRWRLYRSGRLCRVCDSAYW